jgi:hypothetical protein
VPRDGQFSWANGSRLYYATLVIESHGMTLPNTGPEFKGLLGLAVSRLDNATPQRVAQKSSWRWPVIVSSRNSATSFSDKGQIWADNAESSPHFGNVYVCWDQDEDRGAHPTRAIDVATSRDGGETWPVRQASPAGFNVARGLRIACTLRTDSHGVVYLMYARAAFGTPGIGSHVLHCRPPTTAVAHGRRRRSS